VMEKTGANTQYYLHGPRVDEIIADSRGYCYHADGLGSVANLTDASGAKVASYNYQAFGQTRSQTGSIVNPWRYTGRQLDSESGLYFYRNRYYDAKVGRFTSRDPIGIKGGINLYAYCSNNPVNYSDPWGLCEYENGEAVSYSWNEEVGVWTAIVFSPKLVVLGLYAGENAVLYSGPGASALAAASSGIPIFNTAIGSAMNALQKSFNFQFPKMVWNAASAIYATTARGTVQVFITESNYNSTFSRIEAPIIEFLGKAEMIFK